MRARLPIAVALIAGLIIGTVGTAIVCNQGYCGIDGDEQDRVPSPALTTEVLSASEPVDESPAAVAAETGSAVEENPAATHTVSSAVDTTQLVCGDEGVEAEAVIGLAILGDSAADEYRANNQRGSEYGDTTYNWVELLANERGVHLGEWGDWPDSRRIGFGFNWARSGATSGSLLSEGQHTGVAEQVREGLVSHVIIQIGVNDFYYDEVALSIYRGELAGESLQQFLDHIVSNVEIAVQTVTDAGDVEVIVAATQDLLSAGVIPGEADIFSDPDGRQRVIDAFAYVNQGLNDMAAREGVTFFDFNAAFNQELEGRWDASDSRYVLVGSERIDTYERGNEPHHAVLDDEYAHVGTVVSGLISNIFIGVLNEEFGADLEPLDDAEILQIAGIN